MNCRSYHRNSVMAFPKTADYACALERPPKSKPSIAWLLIGVAYLVAVLVLRS